MSISSQDQRAALLAKLAQARGYPGHQRVAERLAEHGITHAYGVSGGPVDELMASCGAAGLRVIGCRSQHAATLAASAHSYLSGDLRAVSIASAGVAVTNCSSAILSARENRWPLLVLGGRRALTAQQAQPFQYLDGAAALAPIAQHTARIEQGGDIDPVLDEACRLARTHPHGPSYVDVCEMVLTNQSPPGRPAAAPPPFSTSPADDLDEVAGRLANAKRPVVVVGQGMRWLPDQTALKALTIGWNAPFIAQPLARGLVPDAHALAGSDHVNWLLHTADAVVLLDAQLDWILRHGAPIQDGAPVVRLAAEHDATLAQRPGAEQIIGPLAHTAARLARALDKHAHERDASWLDELGQVKRKWQERYIAGAEDGSPAAAARALAEALPENATVTLDGNVVMHWVQRLVQANRPLSRLAPGPAGCMGVALPYAMAASLARPEHPSIAITGDFALGTALSELEVLVREALPVVIVLLNNDGNGGSRRQRKFWPEDGPSVCRFTEGARYDQIMQSFGGRGVLLDHPKQLGEAMAEALSAAAPTLIQLNVDHDIALPED